MKRRRRMLEAMAPVEMESRESGSRVGGLREVFVTFLRLGCLSFGGPAAHLGYFQAECVTRRRWCSNERFGELLALCQLLPGPASSQTAFALGIERAGLTGGLIAWGCFTLPSAVLMVAFALLRLGLAGRGDVLAPYVHSLEIVAVAVITQAILTMRRTLAPDVPRLAVAAAATAIALIAPAAVASIAAIVFGGLCGLALRVTPLARVPEDVEPERVPVWTGRIAGVCFAALLVGLPVMAAATGSWQVATGAAFYRTGALVFGGGHVVLPLLQRAVVTPGWTDEATFLAGYGAAQAMPGPLFTFAAYLGAVIHPAGGTVAGMWTRIAGGAWTLAAISVPGLLLVVAALPFWARMQRQRALRAAVIGINAAVIGLLVAALVRPVIPAAIQSPADAVVAVLAVAALMVWKQPPWRVVAGVVVIGMGRRMVGL